MTMLLDCWSQCPEHNVLSAELLAVQGSTGMFLLSTCGCTRDRVAVSPTE